MIPKDMIPHAIGGYIIGTLCIVSLVIIFIKIRSGDKDD